MRLSFVQIFPFISAHLKKFLQFECNYWLEIFSYAMTANIFNYRSV